LTHKLCIGHTIKPTCNSCYMCFLWLQFLSLFCGNSIHCLSCNSLLVLLQFLVCCHLLFLSFVAILALLSIVLMMLQFFFVLSFWCIPYLFSRFLYFVSCYCNSFIVDFFSTKWQLGLGVAPNFGSCSFGLPFLSVSS
jgi:hypothetical protein